MTLVLVGSSLVIVVGVLVFLARRLPESQQGQPQVNSTLPDTAPAPAPAPSPSPEPVAVSAPVSEQAVQRGIRAFMKGRYKEAFALLEPAGHQGNLKAQLLLIKMYYAGNGVPADREKYLYWLSLAADNGDKPSKTKLKKAKSAGNAAQSPTTNTSLPRNPT